MFITAFVVTSLMKAAEVPGVAIARISHGRVASMKAYGFRDVEHRLPLNPDTIMTAASISKAAFAYLCMKLVDDGVLDLDKPVITYFGQPPADYAGIASDPRFARITPRMLLSHTSGLPNWRSLEDDRKLHIHFEPGSRYAYSGEGIVLLQRAVEAITHVPLEALMQQRVFRPLGMTRTSMVWQPRFEKNFANGYDEYSRSLGPERRKTANAAGSMQTTLRDVTRLVLAIANRRDLLSPQIRIWSKHQFPTLENIFTDENQRIRLSYGLGVGLYWTPRGEVFFKEGHDEGWRNYLAMFVQSGDGVVIMTNSSNGEGIFKDLLEQILPNASTPIEWEGYTPYKELPPRKSLPRHQRVTIDPSLLDKYAGTYVFSPTVVLTIRRAGDHLTVQENDETPQDLLPESANQFFSTNADDVYRFESGRVILITGGREIPIPRR